MKATGLVFILHSARAFVPGLRLLALSALLAGYSVVGETNGFRFAWLSDTHIGSSTAEEDLRGAVRDINSMTGLSFVLVSGDVTEYGSRKQLELAREILADLNIPSYVLPGNHDCKWSESGATDFSRLWKGDRFLFEHGGYGFIGMHQGPVMRMGDGHWAPQDVRWLSEVLRQMPDTNQPIIFVTHYPVDDSIANWYEVLDLLKSRNTQAILCGHGHANKTYSFESIPGLMGRSSLRAKARWGGFNLVELREQQLTVCERITGQTTKPAWYSNRLEHLDYATDTNRYPRPDCSVNARYPQVKPLWSHSTGYTIAAAPLVAKNLVVVGDASGAVSALSLHDGRKRWSFQTRSAVYSAPAGDGKRVVFGSTDGNVYALDLGNGAELWRYPTPRPIVASPAIDGKVVYLGSSEGKFRALDLTSGKLLWEYEGVDGFIETRPLVYEGKVIFGAWDQHLYALDVRTGKLVWRWQGDRAGTLLSPAACWPVAARGKVFIVAPDRMMTAIDALTGQEVWRTGDYVVRETIGLSEDRSRFYVRAMNDYFYAFTTAADTPQKLWETNAQFGYDINSATLVERRGVLFYGTKNGLIFALDGRTGSILWVHKIGACLVNTVVPLSATQVVATDADGKTVLLEAKR